MFIEIGLMCCRPGLKQCHRLNCMSIVILCQVAIDRRFVGEFADGLVNWICKRIDFRIGIRSVSSPCGEINELRGFLCVQMPSSTRYI